MESTKEEIEEKIIATLKAVAKKVNPDTILQNLNWKSKDKVHDICEIFGKNKFNEVLKSISGVKLETGSNGTPWVWYDENSATPPHSVSSAKISSDGEVQQKHSESNLGINERFEKLLKYLNSGLYEKEEAVRLALLCAVAGESIFFLGPPGTAKSMISRRIKEAFGDGAEYFEHLMNEFTTPDEIFGTIKLKGLDEGIYEKNTDGFLPQANVAFLDEIWKSGPAILNTLLTIINEKKFHNGNKVEDVPLQILLAASNELPKEKAGLEALYDRFVVRTLVNPVKNEDLFFELCKASGKALVPNDNIKKILLTIDEVKSWQSEIEKVELGKEIREVISQIRKELVVKNSEKDREEKEKFYVSDRRWKKIVKLLKASAFLCGRSAVDLMDLQLITYCIWNTAKQRGEAKQIVEEIVQQHGLEAVTAIDEIEEQIEKFDKDINSTFYTMAEKVTHEEPITKRDSSNYIYYKIQNNNKGIGYISKNYPDDDYLRNCNRHFYLDDNGKNQRNIDNVEIDINNNIVHINAGNYNAYDLRIETKTIVDDEGGIVRDTVLFNNSTAYNSTKISFDKDYKRIADAIENELSKLEKFRTDHETPFVENLFADPAFKEVITSEINKANEKLDDAKVDLEKKKARYAQ